MVERPGSQGRSSQTGRVDRRVGNAHSTAYLWDLAGPLSRSQKKTGSGRRLGNSGRRVVPSRTIPNPSRRGRGQPDRLGEGPVAAMSQASTRTHFRPVRSGVRRSRSARSNGTGVGAGRSARERRACRRRRSTSTNRSGNVQLRSTRTSGRSPGFSATVDPLGWPLTVNSGIRTSPVRDEEPARRAGVEHRLPALVEPRHPVGLEPDVVDVHVAVELVRVVDLEDVDLAGQVLLLAPVGHVVEQVERASAQRSCERSAGIAFHAAPSQRSDR